MFDYEKEVPNLELCKKLRKLGFPQGGIGWYWVKIKKGIGTYLAPDDCFLVHRGTGWQWWDNMTLVFGDIVTDDYYNIEDKIKAPTTGELGRWFPEEIYLNEYGRKGSIRFYKLKDGSFEYTIYDLVKDDDIKFFRDKSEANCRAKVLIWLVENGYINFNQGRK